MYSYIVAYMRSLGFSEEGVKRPDYQGAFAYLYEVREDKAIVAWLVLNRA